MGTGMVEERRWRRRNRREGGMGEAGAGMEKAKAEEERVLWRRRGKRKSTERIICSSNRVESNRIESCRAVSCHGYRYTGTFTPTRGRLSPHPPFPSPCSNHFSLLLPSSPPPCPAMPCMPYPGAARKANQSSKRAYSKPPTQPNHSPIQCLLFFALPYLCTVQYTCLHVYDTRVPGPASVAFTLSCCGYLLPALPHLSTPCLSRQRLYLLTLSLPHSLALTPHSSSTASRRNGLFSSVTNQLTNCLVRGEKEKGWESNGRQRNKR